MRKLPKEYRPLLKAAKVAGAELIERKNGILIRMPNGKTAILHSSPGNAARGSAKRSELRNIGIDC